MTGRNRGHAARHRGRSAAAPPPRLVELAVDEVGGRGDGVGRLDGEPVFIPYALAGDRVLARIEGRRGEGLAAALVEVLDPSPARVPPPCPHFGRCGGCTLQHMAGEAYAAWKRDLLLEHFNRHRLDTETVGPLEQVPPGSRRRATFAFARRRMEAVVGFNVRASHAVVDLETCLLLEPALTALLEPLRPLLAATVPEGGGDVTVTLTDGGLDVLVEAEARLDLFDRERLATFAESADLARLSWRRPGIGAIEPVARRRPAFVCFTGTAGVHSAGVVVEPPPGAFLQPSRTGERILAERILAAVGPGGGAVADLFSGCGSFSLPLAQAGHAVLAVEGEEGPVRALDAAARAGGLAVTTQVRDLARRPLLAHEMKGLRAVVFDPPRAGAAAQAEQLAAAGPPLVVAVSCNPATLARDLRTLVDGGYRLEAVTPVDQFPWSAHLEAVAVLRR